MPKVMALIMLCIMPALAYGRPVRIVIPMVEPFVVGTYSGYHGAGREVAKLIAGEARLEDETDVQPLPRTIISLANNKADLAFLTPQILATQPQATRSKFVDLGYVETIGVALVARQKKDPGPLQDTRRYIVSRLAGTCLPMAKRHPSIQWYEVPHLESVLTILVRDRADMACLPVAFLQYLHVLSGLRPDELTIVDRFNEDVHLYANSALPAQTQASLKQALAKLVTQGKIHALLRDSIAKAVDEIRNQPVRDGKGAGPN